MGTASFLPHSVGESSSQVHSIFKRKGLEKYENLKINPNTCITPKMGHLENFMKLRF